MRWSRACHGEGVEQARRTRPWRMVERAVRRRAVAQRRETMLIKIDMSRGNDTTRRWIIALIAFVVRRITQEDAGNKSGSKFVRCIGFSVRVAEASKHAKHGVVRW